MEYKVNIFVGNRFYKNKKRKNIVIHCRGHIFIKDEVYANQQLADYFSEKFDPNNFEEIINSIDGHFAIIVQFNNKIILIVDRSRSIPLFYSKVNSDIFISDKAELINEKIIGTNDNGAISEIKLIGSCIEDKTLIKEIKQVKTANYAQIDLDIDPVFFVQNEYFNYRKDSSFLSKLSTKELLKELDDVFVKTFKQLIKFADGRKIVVPLSGGLDSRLIVYFLHRLKYKNVLCFTYGKPNNWEANVSQNVAERAGFEWKMIPYSRQMWNEFIYSKEGNDFYKFGSDLNALALFQDFLAIRELKNHIPLDSIFVPGLSMDFLAGSQIPSRLFNYEKFNNIVLVSDIITTYCSTIPHKEVNSSTINLLSNRISEKIDIVTNPFNYAIEFENWFYQEKLVKYVVNSVRAYEYLRFEWSLPFYYTDLLFFWKNIGLEHKIQKKLFLQYLQGRFLFEKIEWTEKTPTKRDKQADNILVYNIKKTIRELRNWKKIMLDYYTHQMQWYGVFNNYLDYLVFSIKNYKRNTSLSLRYIAFIVKRFTEQ